MKTDSLVSLVIQRHLPCFNRHSKQDASFLGKGGNLNKPSDAGLV
jgi:hypothetical protein